MKESCWQFGPRNQLAGIVTEPAMARRRVGIVLVNAGLVPKSGPFRLYSELARRLSEDGFATLRFDLGDIGDSRGGHVGQPLKTRTGLDIRAAVDHMIERLGSAEVVLGGLCSGAEDSFRYAEGDSRVSGVVMIDPFGYPTASWRWRHLLYRAKRRLLRLLGLFRPIPSRNTGVVSYEYMEREESSRILKTLIDRKARTHFIYTGGARSYFNHRGQLRAMFPELDFQGLVALDHFPQLAHTQLLREDRWELIESISRHLREAFPS
jgi:alpha-beta hydrolase superfamily lysophospholipase